MSDTRGEQKPRARLLWPAVLAAVLVLAFLFFRYHQPAKPAPTPGGVGTAVRPTGPFELLITKLVRDRQRFQVLQVDYEYWKEHFVSKEILKIKEGSLADHVTRFAPDWLRDKVLQADWNKSTAHIITKVKAVVTFDVPLDRPADWKITIAGDTATVQAPALNIGDVNVLPETFEGWVLEEGLIIRGDKEKDNLIKTLRTDLLPLVAKDEFKNRYRDACRVSLERLLRNLFTTFGDPATAGIRHVDVQFADDPPAGTAPPFEPAAPPAPK